MAQRSRSPPVSKTGGCSGIWWPTWTRNAVGEGWRQTGRKTPPITKPYLDTFIYWTDGGSTVLNLGNERLDLRRASAAAADLAAVVEQVRARHLALAEQEANAALRRRFPLSGSRD